MSDLCATHQSVTTLTVQQLYNSGFSLSVLTGTKSLHLLSSESDLPTDARKAQAPRLISSGHADLRRRPLSALASSCVGARCAWPGLALLRLRELSVSSIPGPLDSPPLEVPPFSNPRLEDKMNFFFVDRHRKDPKCRCQVRITVVVTK